MNKEILKLDGTSVYKKSELDELRRLNNKLIDYQQSTEAKYDTYKDVKLLSEEEFIKLLNSKIPYRSLGPVRLEQAIINKLNYSRMRKRAEYSPKNIPFVKAYIGIKDSEWLKVPNFGRKSLIELKIALAKQNLVLGIATYPEYRDFLLSVK
jgi:DNA-directed RNA polymerase alpha subunit